jgi:hypothetical protein
MPKKILKECKKHLAERYAWLYNNDSFKFDSDVNSKLPSWIDIDINDLSRPVKDASENLTVGLVVDSDIGMLFYIIPYTESQDVKAKVTNALKIRSELLPDSNFNPEADISDESGSWRVVLCWLLESHERDTWIRTISSLRKETSYLEEIPVDFIARESADTWDSTFNNYMFPRLLFQTRKSLGMASIEESFKWMSADETVKKILNNFSDKFSDSDQILYAKEIQDKAKLYQSNQIRGESETVEAPTRLESLHVKHFRNINNLELKYPTNTASSIILHGPNGTGKSSIFEALSLRVFGTSSRFDMFLRDKEIKVHDKAIKYTDEYLKPISGDKISPSISINKMSSELDLLTNAEESSIRLRNMSGTLLSQEYSSKFSELGSSELASEVLGGYSNLSNILREYIQSRYEEENSKRKNLLGRFDLRANIKVKRTARSRIAQSIVSDEIPPATPALIAWIKMILDISNKDIDGIQSLHDKWVKWNESTAPAKEAGDTDSIEKVHKTISNHLSGYSSLYKNTKTWTANFHEDYLSEIEDSSIITKQINIWGEWLESQGNREEQVNQQELSRIDDELKIKKQEQERINNNGKILRTRLDHYYNLDEILEGWTKEHPSECITCGTDLTDRSGLNAVIDEIKDQAIKERQDLLKQNEEVLNRIAELQKEYDKYAQLAHPLSSDERTSVIKPFSWFLKDEEAFSEYIKNSEKREKLINTLNRLLQVPKIQEPQNIQEESSRIADEIISSFNEYDVVSKAPDDWDMIRKKFMEEAGSIVKDHLPKYLGALWIELAFNLTPAVWLLPGKFQFSIDTLNSGHKVSIKTEENHFVRYLFNQAEIHTLGIGWFFTRYLTHGRFYHNFIVMDDPAQEMDQATYRDMCRLWETIIRLHRRRDIPLSMMVMLHQESRAIDAARATNGQLCVLGWDKQQQDTQQQPTVKHVQLIGEQFKPVKPAKIYQD